MTDHGHATRVSSRHWGRTFAATLAFVALATWGAVAEAKLGDGIKVGPGRLKLGVEADLSYDSLAVVGFTTDTGVPVGPTGDGVGLLRGAFQLDVPGDTVKINALGTVDWNQFATFGAFNFFGTNVLGTVAFNPKGAFGVDISETLNRSDHTNNPLLGVGVLGLSNLTQLRAHGTPGGGAIEFGGFYEFGADAYSPQATGGTYNSTSCTSTGSTCDPTQAADYNALTNRVGVDAKWRLYPKTGLTFESTYGVRSYANGNNVDAQTASPIRVLVGFGTLLTTRTTFAIRAGYTGILFTKAAMRNDVIGQVEGGYRLTETLSARIGFLRTDEPVSGFQLYYADDRVYFDFRGQFNRLVATATAGLDLISYGANDQGGASSRQDTALMGLLQVDYNINDWLRLTGHLGVYTRSIASSDPKDDGVDPTAVGNNYNREEFGVGVATLF